MFPVATELLADVFPNHSMTSVITTKVGQLAAQTSMVGGYAVAPRDGAGNLDALAIVGGQSSQIRRRPFARSASWLLRQAW